MIELAGTEDKIEAFIQLIGPYGVVELARTGVIAMPRGHNWGRPRIKLAGDSQPGQSPDSGVDIADLPPG